MKLILSEEQQFLKDTAQSFARDKTPAAHFRKLRDSDNAKCWDDSIWEEMVQLGWSGILVPEDFGGSDFGIAGISVIMQELGKTLTPSPLLATAVLGVSIIKFMGSEEQKNTYLTKIVSGETTTALAIDEGSHHNPFDIETAAKLEGKSWILNGKKVFVIDGASADTLLIVARTSGKSGESNGLSVFISIQTVSCPFIFSVHLILFLFACFLYTNNPPMSLWFGFNVVPFCGALNPIKSYPGNSQSGLFVCLVSIKHIISRFCFNVIW